MKKQDENIQEGKSLGSFSRDVIHTNKMPQMGERKKAGLKLSIQKTKIMASGPISSWQIDMETMTNFIFLGSKITADGYCSHEIKQCLLLGRRPMKNIDSILKSRHYFADKGPSSQSYGFSSSHGWM